MTTSSLYHSHEFGQSAKRKSEFRTLLVVIITLLTMFVEIWAGIYYGSMALLADGLHMASHAFALLINLFAYIYARRHAEDSSFSFGTGKVNVLGGYTGAILLSMFSLAMAWGSIARLFNPVAIVYNQAIFVAVLGLVVNGVSMLLLGHGEEHEHSHPHEHGHDHHHDHHDNDHNLRSAYLHVLADALTSLLAIIALCAAKYWGMNWMDPAMGILGAYLIIKWSIGLLRHTSAELLDKQVDAKTRNQIIDAIHEFDKSAEVYDLHLWSIGPGLLNLNISIATKTDPAHAAQYRDIIPDHIGVVHATIEITSMPNMLTS